MSNIRESAIGRGYRVQTINSKGMPAQASGPLADIATAVEWGSRSVTVNNARCAIVYKAMALIVPVDAPHKMIPLYEDDYDPCSKLPLQSVASSQNGETDKPKDNVHESTYNKADYHSPGSLGDEQRKNDDYTVEYKPQYGVPQRPNLPDDEPPQTSV